MFSSNRSELRKFFFDAWNKHLNSLPTEPLEKQIIEIFLDHPEYHTLLMQPDHFQEQEFANENPFLHLSLHLALREQINTNRPDGIKKIYQQLCHKLQDNLAAEHSMITMLENILWEAQKNHAMPNEEVYLEYLQKLI